MHNTHNVLTVAILGTAGYTGQETLDRVLNHPELEAIALGSDSQAGQAAAALDPRLLRNGSLPTLVTNDEALASGADLVFCCLSNERAAALDPPAAGVVVDLSGAHRLADTSLYDEWYGFAHPKPDAQADWCYALPELQPPTTRLIANPGCYVTAAALALAPLKEVVDPATVVVDAKSGVSGAGRTLKPSSHAGFVLENVSPYKIGRHQHTPEIRQALGFPVCFVPHLLPVRRGLIATCYVTPLPGAELRELLEAAYAGAPLVDVLPEGIEPELSRVHGTDTAELAVYDDRATGRAVVICALDNLGKGAAGQAIQNANLAFGWSETAGLRHAGVYV